MVLLLVSLGLTQVAEFIRWIGWSWRVYYGLILLSNKREIQTVRQGKTPAALFLEVLTSVSIEKISQVHLAHSDLRNRGISRRRQQVVLLKVSQGRALS